MQPPATGHFLTFPLSPQLSGRDDIEQQAVVGVAQRPLRLATVQFQLALQLWPTGVEQDGNRAVDQFPMHLWGVIEPYVHLTLG